MTGKAQQLILSELPRREQSLTSFSFETTDGRSGHLADMSG